jgi:chaperonin cofactor prefoldin
MKAQRVLVPSPTKRGRGAVFQDTESVITSLKQEIAEKDIRIKTLEEQMVRNAQTFARESTGLKLKLQEQALEDGF